MIDQKGCKAAGEVLQARSGPQRRWPAVRRDSAACLRLRPDEDPLTWASNRPRAEQAWHGPTFSKLAAASAASRADSVEPCLGGEPLRPVELCTRDPDR